jgi:hypothetical protein
MWPNWLASSQPLFEPLLLLARKKLPNIYGCIKYIEICFEESMDINTSAIEI